MEEVLIIKYGEVALRGRNRRLFVNKIIDNVRKNVDPFGKFYVEKEQGRLILECREGKFDFDTIIPKVICIFGILGVCKGIKTTDNNIENLKNLSYEFLKQNYSGDVLTFKIETKRANKNYPLISLEVSTEIGGFILDKFPNLSVNIKNPDITINVEIRNDNYIYLQMIKGHGGLPYGSSGRATVLLSGGIDSPVATYMMAKRGVHVSGVYLHSPPYTSERAKEKVVDLARKISEFTGEFTLYVAPFTDVQLYLLENVPHDKLTIFLKRAMIKIADMVAVKNKSMGLVTGDSVGQVASQTMEALFAIDNASELPIYRPLVAMDKQDIIDIATRIDTFEISTRPYEDCCTVFVPKHPETKPNAKVVKNIEAKLELLEEKLINCFENIEVIEI